VTGGKGSHTREGRRSHSLADTSDQSRRDLELGASDLDVDGGLTKIARARSVLQVQETSKGEKETHIVCAGGAREGDPFDPLHLEISVLVSLARDLIGSRIRKFTAKGQPVDLVSR
jgi:hypothetical protein